MLYRLNAGNNRPLCSPMVPRSEGLRKWLVERSAYVNPHSSCAASCQSACRQVGQRGWAKKRTQSEDCVARRLPCRSWTLPAFGIRERAAVFLADWNETALVANTWSVVGAPMASGDAARATEQTLTPEKWRRARVRKEKGQHKSGGATCGRRAKCSSVLSPEIATMNRAPNQAIVRLVRNGSMSRRAALWGCARAGGCLWTLPKRVAAIPPAGEGILRGTCDRPRPLPTGDSTVYLSEQFG
jgi:hypothetical protein